MKRPDCVEMNTFYRSRCNTGFDEVSGFARMMMTMAEKIPHISRGDCKKCSTCFFKVAFLFPIYKFVDWSGKECIVS